MNHHVFRDCFPDDDPPAPQEPPQHHTPLSPPRSRPIYNRQPWSLSGLGKASSRNSLPVQPSLSRLQSPKTRTRSADETQRTSTCLAALGSIDIRVTKDQKGLMASNISAVDQRTSATPEAQPKNVPSATTSAVPAGAVLVPHVSRPKNEPKSTSPTCGAQRKRPPMPGISFLHNTTTMQPLPEDKPGIPGHPYANTAQAPAAETYFAMRRDSLDADGRSLISTLLDAYCRSEADDEEIEYMRTDDASLGFSDDTISLEYASIPDRSRSPGPPAPTSSIASQLVDSPKHPKPASLIIASPSNWEAESLKLPSSPDSGSSIRNSRPLPPVPPTQRQSRPLPSPPAPPPYTSPVDSTPVTPPLSTFSQSSDSSASAASSPSSGESSLITSVSTSPSTSSAQIKLDKLSSHPKISKRPLLAPIVTFPGSSLGLPSPLTPDIPLPPSPNTAKLHQASKLSKMLGEDITPDLLYGRQTSIRSPNQASKLSKMLGENITPDLLCGRHAPLRHQASKSNIRVGKDTSPDLLRGDRASTRPLDQASKLSNMLGEDITPELLYGRQIPIPPVLPTTRSDSLTQHVKRKASRDTTRSDSLTQHIKRKASKDTTRSDSLAQHVGRKASKDKADPTPSTRPTFTPSPTPRDAEVPNAKMRPRAVRPQAIYLDYDTLEETNREGVGAVAEAAGSVPKVSTSGENAGRLGIQVKPTGGEELDDLKSLSSASGLTVCSDTTSLSELEELDDFEEAHIGWALQNVITYQKASRIKRTSRMWVLEKDGKRWDQQNHANVTTVLGQF